MPQHFEVIDNQHINWKKIFGLRLHLAVGLANPVVTTRWSKRETVIPADCVDFPWKPSNDQVSSVMLQFDAHLFASRRKLRQNINKEDLPNPTSEFDVYAKPHKIN